VSESFCAAEVGKCVAAGLLLVDQFARLSFLLLLLASYAGLLRLVASRSWIDSLTGTTNKKPDTFGD
jgi:hypothetical protein